MVIRATTNCDISYILHFPNFQGAPQWPHVVILRDFEEENCNSKTYLTLTFEQS